jgi:beta-N-acetylhexosaminidase
MVSMRKFGLVSLALLLLMTSTARSQKKSTRKPASTTPRTNPWVEATLRKMTLREKIGQMLMPLYFGSFTSAESEEYKNLLHQVMVNSVGGFIAGTTRGPLGIQRGQVYATAVLTNELQRRAKVPLLIGADFESGTRMRLDGGTSLPSAMAIGATGDPKLAYEAGKITALEARAAGVQWIFAPDADVNNNPDNPIINIRSFGEDPLLVAEYVSQEVKGIQDNGAIATPKHFPGHGDVSVDSHLSLATVPGNKDELEGNELVPFRAAIAAGTSSIMPGHLAIPAFEPDPDTPATTSHAVLTGLLRDEMQFKGLIITDAMDMGGVTSMYPPGEAAVRSVLAGADVLLMPPVPDAAMAGLLKAVKKGRISEKRIDDSVRRILAAKARVGLDKSRFTNVEQIDQKFGRPQFLEAAQKIADRGVTLMRDTPKTLPLSATKPLRVLLVSLSADPDPYPGETIEPEIRSRVSSLTALRADTKFVSATCLKLPPQDTYDVAIAALFVRVADRKGDIAFPAEQRAVVTQLFAAGKPVIVAAFGSPYLISSFPEAPTWLSEFSTNDVSQRASVRAMFGQVPIVGTIPVTVPGTAKRGDGIQLPATAMTLQPAPPDMVAKLKPAFDVVDQGVADDAFPGAVVAVGYKSQWAVHAAGKLTRDADAKPVNEDTMYDMASLTKVVVTTTSVMLLVQQGRLNLDLPVARYIPEFADYSKSDPDPSWRSRITVRMLMLHDSGWPAHRDFYKVGKDYDSVVPLVIAEPLIHEPGTTVEYSDLNFITLGEIIQRLTGDTLDDFAKENIFDPLGMDESMYNPPKALRTNIAPTENDTTYRNRLLVGEVHDENAFAMGGVSGNAGLFASVKDASIFSQMMLNGGIYNYKRILTRNTISQFTSRVDIGTSARTVGWDVPTPPSSSGGHLLSSAAYGHTGFTGTSIWIDPEKDLFVILLTNRVNPTRANEKIRQVRPALADAVVTGLGLANPSPTSR